MNGLAILQRLSGGQFIDDLAEALAQTAEEVVLTGKPARVTVTLKVGTKSQGDPFVVIDETIARTTPRRDGRGAYFFSVDGELHRDDPRQTQLDFRTVDRVTGEIREGDAARQNLREVAE